MKLSKEELSYLSRLLNDDLNICQMHLDETNRSKKKLQKALNFIVALKDKVDLHLKKRKAV